MKKTVVVITGPTASGKTSLAIRLSKKFGGEIVSADSRAIFKGIDIASAKPSIEERDGVPHWGFDLVEIGERFTAADFQKYAYKKFEEIISRGKIPFLVGGTGLYIDSILNDYDFGGEVDESVRNSLFRKSTKELQQEIKLRNLVMPENSKNKRYLVRTIEKSMSQKRNNCKNNNTFDYIVVGITTPREELRERIFSRNEHFFGSGIIEEAILLGSKYGWGSEAMTANAYPLIRKYIDGELSREELIEKMSVRDWRLAKRQITFMKRNEQISWMSLIDAEQFISTKLSKNFD
ncbi:MAG: tRNA (adenosine(37)-N6)-dimethylallyltransferase MiaA [bacterium]|nr:tRNA (adenosine(37)-N6)-dimethylallyltransferase MiaA [bacterium]